MLELVLSLIKEVKRTPTMFTLVAMIRGINVGGKRPIRMDRLKALFADLGLQGVATYLQSGNVVFRSDEPKPEDNAAAIERGLKDACNLEVDVAVRTAKALLKVFDSNPLLKKPRADPRFLHATFLIRPPDRASLKGIDIPLGPNEEAVLVGDVIFLYCPNGYGSTKINNSFFEKKLGVRATTRNWQTVTALTRMAGGEGPRLPSSAA